jgi:hypothetical protein
LSRNLEKAIGNESATGLSQQKPEGSKRRQMQIGQKATELSLN